MFYSERAHSNSGMGVATEKLQIGKKQSLQSSGNLVKLPHPACYEVFAELSLLYETLEPFLLHPLVSESIECTTKLDKRSIEPIS